MVSTTETQLGHDCELFYHLTPVFSGQTDARTLNSRKECFKNRFSRACEFKISKNKFTDLYLLFTHQSLYYLTVNLKSTGVSDMFI